MNDSSVQAIRPGLAGKNKPLADKATAPDTLSPKPDRPKRIPSPQRAVILSAVLPGLGQAYNGSYWKIPIIYAAGAGLYYSYDFYQDRFQESRIALGEPGLSSQEITELESARDYYAKWRNYSMIGIGIVYLANIVEAMTNAYFKQFDVSDDLSFRISPSIIPQPALFSSGTPVNYGVTLCIHFK